MVVLGQSITITPYFHQRARIIFPTIHRSRLVHVGKFSFTIENNVFDKELGEVLLRIERSFAMMNVSNGRSAKIPENIRWKIWSYYYPGYIFTLFVSPHLGGTPARSSLGGSTPVRFSWGVHQSGPAGGTPIQPWIGGTPASFSRGVPQPGVHAGGLFLFICLFVTKILDLWKTLFSFGSTVWLEHGIWWHNLLSVGWNSKTNTHIHNSCYLFSESMTVSLQKDPRRNTFMKDFQPRPLNHFSYSIFVRHSDTDALYHSNQASYFTYFVDAATEAAKEGHFQLLKGDLLSYPIESMECLYKGESLPGDELKVSVWENSDNLLEIFSQIEKGKNVIWIGKMRFRYYVDSKLWTMSPLWHFISFLTNFQSDSKRKCGIKVFSRLEVLNDENISEKRNYSIISI